MRRTLVLAALLIPMSLAGCATAPQSTLPERAVTAVAVQRTVSFRYDSGRFAYTCIGLQGKLSAMLKAVGDSNAARVDLGCASAVRGPLSSAQFRFPVLALVPATAENIESLTQYSPREKLLAHIQSRYLPSAEQVPTVRAEWTQISIDTGRTKGLDAGDCELVEDFRAQVAPQLGLRAMGEPSRCNPSAAWKFSHRVTLQVLLPVADQMAVMRPPQR